MVRTVDCKGMPCPLPIITLRRTMAECEAGVEMEVLLDSELSAHNVQRYLADYGIALELHEEAGVYAGRFINPAAVDVEGAIPECATVLPEGGVQAIADASPRPKNASAAVGDTLVVVDSDTLGRGSDELGGLLMKGMVATLAEWERAPSHVVLMNSGVRLAVGQSGTVEALRQLEQSGTAVWLCGTCVDYFNISNEVGVGEVRNMYDISRAISLAPRVVRL